MRVTILGSGGSSGTPAIDWGWSRCDPENPKNRRLRPSILVEDDGVQVLVDSSPDLRQQLLAAGVKRLDAVLYTHIHADHVHGIDDLRAINRAMDATLDAYGDAATLAEIGQRFPYVFSPSDRDATVRYKPSLVPHEIAAGQTFAVAGMRITAFEQDHGGMKTMGYRFGAVAYSTDVVDLPEASFAALDGVEAWIIGPLADTPHPTHAHVDKALEWIARVKPRRAVLTHLSSLLDHEELGARLPDGVEVAYDGMVIEAAAGS